MRNKKLFLATTLIALSSTSSAFAKTEGNYIGLDLGSDHASMKYYNPVSESQKNESDASVSVGVSYKYAFNFNNIFIAPGLFYESLGLSTDDSLFANLFVRDSVDIEDRSGLKVDVGYDLNDKWALYFTNGLAGVNYRVNWENFEEKADRKWGYFYGLGVNYNISKRFMLNFEYNMQNINLNTPVSGNKVDADISVAKVGISYHF